MQKLVLIFPKTNTQPSYKEKQMKLSIFEDKLLLHLDTNFVSFVHIINRPIRLAWLGYQSVE